MKIELSHVKYFALNFIYVSPAYGLNIHFHYVYLTKGQKLCFRYTFIVDFEAKLLTVIGAKKSRKINKYQKLFSLFHLLPVDSALVVSGARMQRA
jgi:hypothetical protein